MDINHLAAGSPKQEPPKVIPTLDKNRCYYCFQEEQNASQWHCDSRPQPNHVMLAPNSNKVIVRQMIGGITTNVRYSVCHRHQPKFNFAVLVSRQAKQAKE